MNTEMADGAAQRCVAQIGEALFGQPGMTLVEIANSLRMARGSGAPLLCASCCGLGMIGGPSFYAPDEGGEPCPDCVKPSPAGQGDALDHVLREMEAGTVQMLPDPAPEVIRGWAVRIRAAQVSPVDRGLGLISLLQELRAASARNEMNGLEADSIGLTEAARRCDVRSETIAMVANKLEAALAARQPVGVE